MGTRDLTARHWPCNLGRCAEHRSGALEMAAVGNILHPTVRIRRQRAGAGSLPRVSGPAADSPPKAPVVGQAGATSHF